MSMGYRGVKGMATKVIKSGKMTPVRGGSGHMASKGHATRRVPGVTGGVQGAVDKYACGGHSNHMFGKQSAKPARPK
jgi:hypothetical protein